MPCIPVTTLGGLDQTDGARRGITGPLCGKLYPFAAPHDYPLGMLVPFGQLQGSIQGLCLIVHGIQPGIPVVAALAESQDALVCGNACRKCPCRQPLDPKCPVLKRLLGPLFCCHKLKMGSLRDHVGLEPPLQLIYQFQVADVRLLEEEKPKIVSCLAR